MLQYSIATTPHLVENVANLWIKAGFIQLKLHQNGTRCHIRGYGKPSEVENGLQSCSGVTELAADIFKALQVRTRPNSG